MSFTGGGAAPTVPYYNYTTFTFTLIGDRYGTETTWSLKMLLEQHYTLVVLILI